MSVFTQLLRHCGWRGRWDSDPGASHIVAWQRSRAPGSRSRSPPAAAPLTRESPAAGDSPLSRRQGLTLLGALVAATVVVVGAIIAAALLVPAAREGFGLMLAVALPVCATGLRQSSATGFGGQGQAGAHSASSGDKADPAPPVADTVALAAPRLSPKCWRICSARAAPRDTGRQRPLPRRRDRPGRGTPCVRRTALLTPVSGGSVFRGVVHGGVQQRFGWIGASFFSAAANVLQARVKNGVGDRR